MDGCVILVATDLANVLQQLLYSIKSAGNTHRHDRAVTILFRNIHIQLRHVLQVRALFAAAHLIPLGIIAVTGMHLAEGFHGQPEFQFKRRHLTTDGLTLQGSDKSLARGHCVSLHLFVNFAIIVASARMHVK